MTHPITPILAHIPSATFPRISKGTGIIESKPGTNTFALRTTTDIIPLTLSPGIVQDGDTVKYLIRNDTIILTPLTNKSSQGLLQQSTDTLTVTSDETTKPAQSVTSSSSSLPLPQNFPAGLYRFASTNKALDFLGQSENSPIRFHLDELIANEGLITLKVDENAIGEKFAYVFNKAESSYALSTFLASLSSPILGHATTVTLESILDKNGTLAFDLWNQLDRFLSDPENLRSAANNRPASVQAPLTLQWLQTALSSTLSLEKLLRLHPLSSTAALFKGLEPLMQQLSLYTGSPAVPLDTLAISAASFDATNTREGIVPDAIDSLGLTLENALSLTDGLSRQQFSGQNLKSLLLQQQQALTGDHMISGAKSIIEANQNAAAVNVDHIPTAIVLPALLTSTFFDQIHTLQIQIDTLIADRTPATIYQKPAGETNGITTAPVFTAPADPEATEPPAIIAVLDTLRATCVTLKAAAEPKLTNHLQPTEQQSPTPTIANLLRSSQQQLSANLRDLTGLLTPASTTPVAPTVQKQTADIELLVITVAALEKNLALILPHLTTVAEHQPPFLDRTKNTMGNRSEETISPHPEKIALHNHLKQSVETALNHLESLQVLARPVATQQGTTQIFALPIKIGLTWTEVTIQLVTQKKQSGKKRRGHTRYMVNLDVAPSALGIIHVGLDYQPKQCLNATLAFEEADTSRWFTQHKDALVQSLCDLGIPAPQIQYIPLEKKKRHTARNHINNPLGTVDLTI